MLNSDINTNNFIDNISNNNNKNIEISEIKLLKLGKNKINFPKDLYENEINKSIGNIISSNENFIPFLSNSSNKIFLLVILIL